MTTDQAARLTALDITRSFIVQAPAGSGKTELLTQRFLKLLAHVQHPEEILAITFTKKAVHEMQTRIMNALRSAHHQPTESLTHTLAKAVLVQNEKQQWHLLDHPGRLNIQTIDAFSARLNQRMPFLSGFNNPLTITEDALPLYRAAVRHLFDHLQTTTSWQAALRAVLLYHDNRIAQVEHLFIRLLEKRDQWLCYLNRSLSREALENHLRLAISYTLNKLGGALTPTQHRHALKLIQFAAHSVPADHPFSQCQETECISTRESWQALHTLLCTEKGEWRKQWGKAMGFPSDHPEVNTLKLTLKTLIEELDTLPDFKALLNDASRLPHPEYTEMQWEILSALLQLLPVLCAELQLVFQEHGQIDYIENALRALSALGDEEAPTDLALYLEHRITHILMDEFQDTSHTQWQLLEKLVSHWDARHTLFLVGDPLQSIYRFREADVNLFLRAQTEGIAHCRLIPLHLHSNFRTHAPLVDWFNRLFQTIFPKESNRYEAAIAYYLSSPSIDAPAHIHVQSFVDETHEEEAAHIIHIIRDIKQRHPQHRIAILVRAKTHLHPLLSRLHAAHLSYVATEVNRLWDDSLCQDVWHLLRAYSHLADRTAWLALLRAPFIGLSLTDLLHLARDKNRTIWEAVLTETNVSTDGQQRLDKVKNIFTYYFRERHQASHVLILQDLCTDLGVMAVYTTSQHADILAQFCDILRAQEKSDFTVDLDELKRQLQQQYTTVTTTDPHPIHVMTIHKAKGLEFDAVIVPRLDARPRQVNSELLLWADWPIENTTQLLLAPLKSSEEESSPLYDFIQRLQHKKQMHELSRLLYVACTRAKSELYLTASVKTDAEGALKKPHPSSLLKIAGDVMTSPIKTAAPSVITENMSFTHRRLATLQIVTRPAPLSPSSSSIMLPALIDHTIVGSVTHHCLALLADQPHTVFSTEIIEKQCRSFTLPATQLKEAIALVQTALQRMRSDARGQWILQPHREAYAELPLSGMFDGKIEHHVIDRIFLDENNIRWIIDYKITQALDTFDPTLHHAQLARYHTLWQALHPTETIKTALYLPLQTKWYPLEIAPHEPVTSKSSS